MYQVAWLLALSTKSTSWNVTWSHSHMEFWVKLFHTVTKLWPKFDSVIFSGWVMSTAYIILIYRLRNWHRITMNTVLLAVIWTASGWNKILMIPLIPSKGCEREKNCAVPKLRIKLHYTGKWRVITELWTSFDISDLKLNAERIISAS